VTENARETTAGPAPSGRTPPSRTPGEPGPRPEPLRFFGTTWLAHDGGYGARRAAVGIGALLSTAAGALVLKLAYEGIALADVGGLVNLLLIVMFTLCTAMAFARTWQNFTRRPDPAAQQSVRGLMAIGFLGTLLAHAVRCLSEAPGESLARTEYEEARRRYEKRHAKSAARTGARPGTKGRGKPKRR
jgi:hypothetical protein